MGFLSKSSCFCFGETKPLFVISFFGKGFSTTTGDFISKKAKIQFS